MAASRLRIVRHGHGPRWFLGLHGLAGTAETFAPILPHLPDDATLIAVDLPGYGASEAPPEWTIPAIAAVVAAGLRDHGFAPPDGQWTIVGNCSGAIVGAAMHQAEPERFARLVLVEPFAYVPWYFDLFTWPLLGPLFFYTTFHTRLGRWLTNRGLRDTGDASVDKTSGFDASAWDTPVHYLRALKRVGSAAAYAGTPGPATLVRGQTTFAAIVTSIAHWRAVWPDAHEVVLAPAGHLPFQEAPEPLAAVAFAESEGDERGNNRSTRGVSA